MPPAHRLIKIAVFLSALSPLLITARLRPAQADPRAHDGLYLRLGVGGGYAVGTLSTGAESDSKGFNIASELAVGLTVAPGLVVGLGTFPLVVQKPDYTAADAGGQHVSGTGPFVAYYLDQRGGLHLQGGLLFAAGYLDGSATRPSQVGAGYGGMLGVGYDRFVSAEWSLGALFRATAYRLYGVDDSLRLASPSLLVTATFH